MAENDLSIRSSAAEYLTYIASTGNTDKVLKFVMKMKIYG